MIALRCSKQQIAPRRETNFFRYHASSPRICVQEDNAD